MPIKKKYSCGNQIPSTKMANTCEGCDDSFGMHDGYLPVVIRICQDSNNAFKMIFWNSNIRMPSLREKVKMGCILSSCLGSKCLSEL